MHEPKHTPSDHRERLKKTDLPADRVLFSGKAPSLVVTFYKNERPPCGLLGQMDWYFHGVLSQLIRKGAITGRPGECTYFPLTKAGRIYHLILMGAGQSKKPGHRSPLPPESMDQIRKNLLSLQISSYTVSQSDFGDVEPTFFEKHLKGVPLWITP